jgi:CRP-like cAMP-binding protein
MGLISLTIPNKDFPPRKAATYAAAEVIYDAGSDGMAWRVKRGVVRLNTNNHHGDANFASLAITGDIIGCESMLFGIYTFSAAALTECELSPWPQGEPGNSGESLLQSLAQAQSRAANIIALRGGQATNRVLGLIRLLGDGANQVVLPTRQDIADITDLRFETISRIIKGLEREGILRPVKIEGVHATRSYAFNPAAI